jgi:L-lactate dehydrogenase complex protein LldF
MVSEESALDRAIERQAQGGRGRPRQYILQINDHEPSSHIIGPALHKSKEEVPTCSPRSTHAARLEIEELCVEACQCRARTTSPRTWNFAVQVAETGSVVLVTNEATRR